MSDLQLVQRYSREKDAEAFAEVVRVYQGMVVATCRRVCFEQADVEDAAQEVFLRMALRAGEIRANLGAWLHRCAVNVARDLNRTRRRQLRRETVVAIAVDAVSKGGQRVLAELRECVDAAMERLSDDERELIVQRFFAGRSQVEIAQTAGVSPATIGRRVANAVDALRGQLAGVGMSAVELEAWLGTQTGEASATLMAQLAKIGLSGVGKTGGAVAVKVGVAAAVLVGAMGVGAWMASEREPMGVAVAAATQPVVVVAPAANERTMSTRRLIYELRVSRLTSSADVWGRRSRNWWKWGRKQCRRSLLNWIGRRVIRSCGQWRLRCGRLGTRVRYRR